MQSGEPRTFASEECEGHREINHHDPEQLKFWAAKLEATPDEVIEAVRTVGTNCTAVAIWLGSAGAL